jgi:hypothetical protein
MTVAEQILLGAVAVMVLAGLGGWWRHRQRRPAANSAPVLHSAQSPVPVPVAMPVALPRQVAGLMRAGGWRQVTVAAGMGHLGTDVLGVGADGRRWVVRCHHEAARLGPADVRRFADTVRELRRGEVVVLVTEQTVSTALRLAAQRCGTRLVDTAGLAWWAGLQASRSGAAGMEASRSGAAGMEASRSGAAGMEASRSGTGGMEARRTGLAAGNDGSVG